MTKKWVKNDTFLGHLCSEIGCKNRGKRPKIGQKRGPKSDPKSGHFWGPGGGPGGVQNHDFGPSTVSVGGYFEGWWFWGYPKYHFFWVVLLESSWISRFFDEKSQKWPKITKMAKIALFGAVGESAKIDVFSRPGSQNEFVWFVGYPLWWGSQRGSTFGTPFWSLLGV